MYTWSVVRGGEEEEEEEEQEQKQEEESRPAVVRICTESSDQRSYHVRALMEMNTDELLGRYGVVAVRIEKPTARAPRVPTWSLHAGAPYGTSPCSPNSRRPLGLVRYWEPLTVYTTVYLSTLHYTTLGYCGIR